MKPMVLVCFVLGWTGIFRSASSRSCVYRWKATRNFQILQSPFFPQRFPAQTQCTWIITAQPGERVKVQFSSFHLHKKTVGKCLVQWLAFMDGVKEATVQDTMHMLCGRSMPSSVVSQGPVMRVSLHSDASAGESYLGFRATYTSTKESPTLKGRTIRGGSRTKPGLNDNQRIEELNKRRNAIATAATLSVRYGPFTLSTSTVTKLSISSAPPSSDHRYLAIDRRFPDKSLGLTESSTTTTTTRPTAPPLHVQLERRNRNRNRKSSQMAPEVRTVLIVIGIIVALFVVVIVARKMKIAKKLRKKKEASFGGDEKAPVVAPVARTGRSNDVTKARGGVINPSGEAEKPPPLPSRNPPPRKSQTLPSMAGSYVTPTSQLRHAPSSTFPASRTLASGRDRSRTQAPPPGDGASRTFDSRRGFQLDAYREFPDSQNRREFSESSWREFPESSLREFPEDRYY